MDLTDEELDELEAGHQQLQDSFGTEEKYLRLIAEVRRRREQDE